MDAVEESVMKELVTLRASVNDRSAASTESGFPFNVSPRTYITGSIALLTSHSAE